MIALNFIARRFFSTSTAANGRKLLDLPLPAKYSPPVAHSFSHLVGNTSLVKLRSVSELTGCNILAKCEWENPAGSVKDRAALFMIREAEEKGILVPGEPGLVVEGTAGNTGLGLAAVARSRGYGCVIVMPDTQSTEKKNGIRWNGAHLLEVPAAPFKNPMNYVHIATRLALDLQAQAKAEAESTDTPLLNAFLAAQDSTILASNSSSSRPSRLHVFYADQWGNLANRRAHIESTGPEIWYQTKGKIDAFSCASGSGGTISGVGTFLRSQNKNIKIALTDPRGSALVRYFNLGELRAEGDSISEGIGQSRITGNMEGFKPDLVFEIADPPALRYAYDLLEQEGLCVGLSSAINIAGAVEVAKKLGPGHTIVTILCDLGTRYSAKMFNPTFLRSRGLPVPKFLDSFATPEAAIAALATNIPASQPSSISRADTTPFSTLLTTKLNTAKDPTKI